MAKVYNGSSGVRARKLIRNMLSVAYVIKDSAELSIYKASNNKVV